ncbi:ABC transporter substrate-binding protein [Ilumatobacter sp.]|uniref:ABC transporter substrate-binding protein n=1 Tax=Ilumatobacter sp. TaxID=1967498 RepID=UPI003AF605B8
MKIKQLAGVLVACALVAAACSDDGDESAETTTVETTEASSGEMSDEETGAATAEETAGDTSEATSDDTAEESGERTTSEAITTTTTATDDTVPAADLPQAIISLSPTATEMLYAIGAGDQVLAVDEFSNHPPEAADKMQGLSGFEPNVEAIAGLEPDLVVTDGTNPDFLAQLDTLDIAHWEGPAAADFDDVYAQIEQLGAATGHVADAAELVASMRTEIGLVGDEVPELDQPLTYYHELDPTLFSATSETFIGAVYAELGLVNIADAVGDGNPFPQLNAEFIIDENPVLIFLADTKCCGESADSVASRPGWGDLDAVANNGVIEMDDDIASRWGPRIVDYLRLAAKAVINAAAPTEVG